MAGPDDFDPLQLMLGDKDDAMFAMAEMDRVARIRLQKKMDAEAHEVELHERMLGRAREKEVHARQLPRFGRFKALHVSNRAYALYSDIKFLHPFNHLWAPKPLKKVLKKLPNEVIEKHKHLFPAAIRPPTPPKDMKPRDFVICIMRNVRPQVVTPVPKAGRSGHEKFPFGPVGTKNAEWEPIENSHGFDDCYNYEGAWLRGKLHGRGVFTFADGGARGKYTGYWMRGSQEGHGEANYEGDFHYSGEWKGGRFHGEGEATLPDGSVYRGAFLEGRRHGKGTQTSPTGAVYEGDWERDLRHGRGTQSNSLGYVYNGTWVDGYVMGSGVLTEPSGERHVRLWAQATMYEVVMLVRGEHKAKKTEHRRMVEKMVQTRNDLRARAVARKDRARRRELERKRLEEEYAMLMAKFNNEERKRLEAREKYLNTMYEELGIEEQEGDKEFEAAKQERQMQKIVDKMLQRKRTGVIKGRLKDKADKIDKK